MMYVKSLLVLVFVGFACSAHVQTADEMASVYADLRFFESPMALALKADTDLSDISRLVD